MVLENGTITTASETTNQGLFWGLRGAGGSNFGVVTKVSIKVFQAEPEYFAGSINLRTENPEVWRKIIKGWLDGAQDLTVRKFCSGCLHSLIVFLALFPF